MDTSFKLNLIDLPACSFCNQYIEIIEHFLMTIFITEKYGTTLKNGKEASLVF